MIYRSYDIEQRKGDWAISKDGEVIHSAPSEDLAMKWVDNERRRLAEGHEKWLKDCAKINREIKRNG